VDELLSIGHLLSLDVVILVLVAFPILRIFDIGVSAFVVLLAYFRRGKDIIYQVSLEQLLNYHNHLFFYLQEFPLSSVVFLSPYD
jgi:hypothetical protein